MTGEVRVESSPVGPVVHPPVPAGLAVLYLHGDRYLAGAPETALGLAGQLALRTGATVICPRYRCAFPDALEDVHDGYRYSREASGSAGRAGFPGSSGPGPVVIAGERLGAGLAAALLIRLRDAGAGLPVGAVLTSALLDLTLQAPSLLLNQAADPAFLAAELRRQVARYAAGTALTDPLLSPLRANLHGLPPIQLLAAGNDVLLDDSLAFTTRAARSGVTVHLQVRSDQAGLRAALAPAMAAFIGERAAAAAPAGGLLAG
jgi:acetyl esterase/lipase